MPCVSCLPAPPHRDSRIQRLPRPPTRQVRPLSRTRTCPRRRVVWCEGASSTRPASCRIQPRRSIETRQKLLPYNVGLAEPPHQQVAILSDVTINARFASHPLQITLRDRAKSAFGQGIDCSHEMARETLHHVAGQHVCKSFFLQGGDKRVQPRLFSRHRYRADHCAEYQPRWRFIFGNAGRPPEAPTANQTLIDEERIRPV